MLTAAVALVGALCLLDIALTLGVARQLRDMSRTLAAAVSGAVMLAAGATVGDFTATTVDGDRISRADLKSETLVGFLSPGCPACVDSLPSFIRRAEEMSGGRAQVLAVVLGDDEETGDLCRRLTPMARVVTEDGLGSVARAFGVVSYPAFALLSGHTVVASHIAVDRVPETVPA